TANGRGSAANEAKAPSGSGSAGPRRARGGHDDVVHPGFRPGDLKSDQGVNAQEGNGAAARELPDGSDDDIVSRRLRKAAEQETDPELKEKLWKEYAEYKKNTQGR